MHRPGGELRFRVVAPDGRRSSTWKVTVGRTTTDIYILSRPLGGTAKVSLHASGRWRHAFVSDEQAAAHLPPGADRAFDKFEPPSEEVAEGWSLAYAVCIPESELQQYPAEKGKITDLPPAGAGCATLVMLLLSKPGAPPLAWKYPRIPVGAFDLIDGSRLLLLAEPREVPDSLRADIERVRSEALQQSVSNQVDRHSTSPVTALLMGGETGERWTVEIAAWQT